MEEGNAAEGSWAWCEHVVDLIHSLVFPSS